MKAAELRSVIANIPRTVAVFEVTSVPYWAEQYVAKGDLVEWDGLADCTRTGDGVRLTLGAGSLKFAGYKNVI